MEAFKEPRNADHPICDLLGPEFVEFLLLNSILVPVERADTHRGLLTLKSPISRIENPVPHAAKLAEPGFYLIGVPYSTDQFSVRSTIYGSYWVQELTRRSQAFCGRHLGNILSLSDEGSRAVFDRISLVFQLVSNRSRVPIFIGGDHSMTFAAFNAATEIYDDVHLIRFDAHYDRASIDALNGNRWPVNNANFVRHLEASGAGERLHILGVREKGNTGLCDEEVRATLAKIGTSPTYVSVDADVLNLGEAPDVNYPIRGGISSGVLRAYLDTILASKNVVGLDFVEHCSGAENPSQTAIVISDLVKFVGNHGNYD